LVRAFSTDSAARERVAQELWDAIYIDGNHDYEVARRDWDLCAKQVRTGGIIVLDDSALYTAYRPPAFATAGHPGPSRVAREVDQTRFREVLRVGHNRVFQRTA
jgi:predicted O-methyltransferase YrrM